MDPRTLQGEAEKLLEKMHLVPPREPGERLRADDEAKILELASEGLTQEQIAADVGCHQSTVSRTIAEYDDSRPLARKYLEARTLDMSKRFVAQAKPAELLRMLGKLDVVRDDEAADGVHLGIVLGVEGWAPPARDQVVVTINAAPSDGSQAAQPAIDGPVVVMPDPPKTLP